MPLFDPTMFGDERGGGLLGIGGMPRQQPSGIADMLLALGAGIAGGRDWGSGIGAGLQGALGVKQALAQRALLAEHYADKRGDRREDVDWRRQQAEEARRRHELSYGLQAGQLGLARENQRFQQEQANRPEIVTDPNTNQQFVRNRISGELAPLVYPQADNPVAQPGTAIPPPPPGASPQKWREQQTVARVDEQKKLSERASAAEDYIRKIGSIEPTVRAASPDLFGNINNSSWGRGLYGMTGGAAMDQRDALDSAFEELAVKRAQALGKAPSDAELKSGRTIIGGFNNRTPESAADNLKRLTIEGWDTLQRAVREGAIPQEKYDALVKEFGGPPNSQRLVQRQQFGNQTVSGKDQSKIPQSAISQGVDPKIWQFMTPEQRALWK